MSFCQLSERQLDLLQEVSNIGMGHAATALSQLLNRTIQMQVPRLTMTGFDEVSDLLGGAERLVAGVNLKVLGAARGDILMIFPLESAERLLADLVGITGATPFDEELGVSTLLEIGNILASSYLTALGQMLGNTLIPSVPRMMVDKAGSVVDGALIEQSRSADLALMIETEFFDDTGRETPIRGHFFLLPDPETLHVLRQLAGEGG